jgi:Ca2+-binding RTX toxin-like protein
LGDDRIWGGDGDDTLQGNAGRDWLTGDAGTDRIYGADGNDTLTGGLGEDWLTGGLGADRFEQSTAGAGQDWITDYASKQGDHLFYVAAATKAQFRVTFAAVTGAGSATAEAFVTHAPSGQVLWVITDGAVMTDIHLRLGAITYDLI